MDPIIQHSLYIGITFIVGTTFGVVISKYMLKQVSKLTAKFRIKNINAKQYNSINEEVLT